MCLWQILQDDFCLQGSSENTSGIMLPEDVVAAKLETVLYAQMLILFAPQASSIDRHLPLLMSCLASRQPALRQAAASTLHHLAGNAHLDGLSIDHMLLDSTGSVPGAMSCGYDHSCRMQPPAVAPAWPPASLPSAKQLPLPCTTLLVMHIIMFVALIVFIMSTCG